MKPIALVILALGVLAAKAQLTCGGPGCGPDSPLSLQVGGAEFVRISDHSGTPVKFRYSGVRGWAGAPQLSPNFIAVAPASGTTPDNIRIGLNPAVIGSMRSGIHRLEIMFTSVDVDTPTSASAFVIFRLPASPPPAITSVVNTASEQPFVSPGAIVAVNGTDLARPDSTAAFDDTTTLPNYLGNTSVYFNGVAAPLMSVSPGRIEALVPFALDGQTNLEVVVKHFDQLSEVFTLPLSDTSPGIFTSGKDAIRNMDPTNLKETFNGPDNPAPSKTRVIVCANGAGNQNNPFMGGDVALAGSPFRGRPVTVTIGGQPANIRFENGPYTYPYRPWSQICVKPFIDENVQPGPQPIVVTIGEKDSSQQNAVVWVQ